MTTIDSSFADFVLFLYVHMTHSDGDCNPKELNVIRVKMAKLFPAGTNHEKKLADAIAQYKSIDKTGIHDFIQDSFLRFKQVKFNQKHKVYRDMYDIIYADGRIDASETKLLDSLKKILDSEFELKNA